MNIKLYNTLSRSIELFVPLQSGKVSMYCCGPTVYNYQHIGNMRTYIFEDLLRRSLLYAGYNVKHVMNITDVGHLTSDGDSGEDKMIVAMQREGKSSLEIAEFYSAQFFEDCSKLHIKRPNIVCKATDHIREMIELIKRLEENGLTYFIAGNVYFDVSKFNKYGELASLDIEKLQAGARVEVDKNKRNPLDFVLWFTNSKFKDQELQWDSPWGKGYPGWHIECSAMSMKYLGEQFDIHCGGIDHVPVHHTNEIAQSEGATGKSGVSIWMHGEFLVLNEGKMSKSKNGFITLHSVIERGIHPLSFRYLCLNAHYRKQLRFSWDILEGANNSLKNLQKALISIKQDSLEPIPLDQSDKYLQEFRDSILNDLNSAAALSCAWNVIADKNLSASRKLGLLYDFDRIFGLDMANWKEALGETPSDVLKLVEARDLARKNRDWAQSDLLRDKLVEMGYGVEDSPSGTKVKLR